MVDAEALELTISNVIDAITQLTTMLEDMAERGGRIEVSEARVLLSDTREALENARENLEDVKRDWE
jgi:FtsZ-binding cell division protein ZapB